MIDELQRVFNQHIPITKDLGVSVKSYTGKELTLFTPLDKNINHKSSAFGGSIYSACVLAGWGMLYMKLKEQGLDGHIVIFESNISYTLPIEADFNTHCIIENENDVDRFVTIYNRKGKARLDLNSNIYVDGKTAVYFRGRYVVHK